MDSDLRDNPFVTPEHGEALPLTDSELIAQMVPKPLPLRVLGSLLQFAANRGDELGERDVDLGLIHVTPFGESICARRSDYRRCT